jgi:hypothetical protein
MSQRAPIHRIDINGQFRADDPALAELLAEASARGVSVQQHIYDLLMARYLARRGQSFEALLWTPCAAVAAAPEPAAPTSAAGAAAAAWLGLQEE